MSATSTSPHPLRHGSLDGPKKDDASYAFKWAEQYREAQRFERQQFREMMRHINHPLDCPMHPKNEAGYGICSCGLVGLVRRNW